jgi:hypothetical protein
MIALALLGVLAGVVAYRSQPSAPLPRPAPPANGETEDAAARPSRARSSNDAPAVTTPLEPSAAHRPSSSVAPGVRRPGPARSDDRGASIELRVAPERRGLFRISGSPRERLAPGLTVPLDLMLTNPQAVAVSVRSVAVWVASVSAPRADAGHPCGARDFAVAQYSGRGLRLRPRSKTTLGRLGFARSRWPRLSMLNRPINQDGCKGAALTLAYRGAGAR